MEDWVHLRMRFPPFDEPAHEAAELPIADVCWQDEGDTSELKIGSESSWFIDRSRVDSPPPDSQVLDSPPSSEGSREPRQSRTGWALSPHPLHNVARKLIPYAVAFLILGVVIHALEPVLLRWGVMTEALAGSVRFGLLEYPVLFVAAGPLVVTPIIMRVVANVVDIRSQRNFSQNPPNSPEITIESALTDQPVRFTCKFPDSLNPSTVTARLRVGALSPDRSAWMAAHGRRPGSRPPPGLSTPLPGSWMPQGVDGSGVGESTPLLIGRGSSQLFQEPMRLRAEGTLITLGEGVNEVPVPEGPWPASEYGPLVSIHHELVFNLKFSSGRTLHWLQPVDVSVGKTPHSVPNPIVDSGRLESTTDSVAHMNVDG